MIPFFILESYPPDGQLTGFDFQRLLQFGIDLFKVAGIIAVIAFVMPKLMKGDRSP